MSSPAAPPALNLSILSAAEKWLRRALAAVSAGFILLFLYTAARRLHYPFSLEQVESGMLAGVLRLAHGQPLYSRPTLDFVPYLYAPLYYYVALALAKLTGLSYVTLRLVSILSTLGSMAVLYAMVFSETRKPLAAFAAAGFYAACYHPLQAWFDIGRVDSLFIFLFLLALFCTRRAPVLLAVLVWILAFQTKQGILPVALLIFCSEWRRPRRMLVGMVSLIAGIGASVLLLNHVTGGWYSFYVFGSTRGLGWLWRQAVFYLPVDFMLPFGLALLLILAALLLAPPSLRHRKADFYLVTSFAVYAAVGYLRAHYGSSQNTLMPAYAWTAILFGLALDRLLTFFGRQPGFYAQAGTVVVLAAAVMQLSAQIYQPGRYIPAASIRQQRQALLDQLRAIPGDVYVVFHADDPILAGKQPHAIVNSFGLITAGPPTAARTAFMQDFQRAVDTHRFSAFVVDQPITPDFLKLAGMPSDLAQQYPIVIPAKGNQIVDVTSSDPHEKWIYLPCSAIEQDDLNAIIPPGDDAHYGNCPNAPTATHVQP